MNGTSMNGANTNGTSTTGGGGGSGSARMTNGNAESGGVNGSFDGSLTLTAGATTLGLELKQEALPLPPITSHGNASSNSDGTCLCHPSAILADLWSSTDLLFQSKSTWLLILGPIAVIGNATGIMGEAPCFCLSGIALIPCAERLSFVTERLADHTNGTIGALLNATFGNAPELLITIFALRSGYYRVVQLAMLGSMLTNMTLVFGAACLIGGLQWHVQDLRMTSGNVNVGMLLLATAGMLFPAALVLSGQLPYKLKEPNLPSPVEVSFCRVNAFVMMTLYVLFLVFTVGSHKDEFDDDARFSHSARRAKRNLFCLRHFGRAHGIVSRQERNSNGAAVVIINSSSGEYGPLPNQVQSPVHRLSRDWSVESGDLDLEDVPVNALDPLDEEGEEFVLDVSREERPCVLRRNKSSQRTSPKRTSPKRTSPKRSDCSGSPIVLTSSFQAASSASTNKSSRKNSEDFNDGESIDTQDDTPHRHNHNNCEPPVDMSMTTCIIWLFIITLCISAMTDILVDTIDGFAQRMGMSEVFTSMVIVPFFSNVAEQISAFIFAYRNEMDLCVGVTVGSAIQIATFVLPASVLMGMVMDRSMTLYFHGYETVCMFFAVVTVAAVLQGGTTNWLVGAILIGIYIMFATGIWFHENENLTMDEEVAIRNVTGLAIYDDVVPP